MKKIAPRYGFAAVAALLTFSFGAYFGCERLRHDALRGIQFAPFLTDNGDFGSCAVGTRLAATSAGQTQKASDRDPQ